LLKDGGTKRRTAAEQLVMNAGGKLEAFYFAFGNRDAFIIVDAAKRPFGWISSPLGYREEETGAMRSGWLLDRST
jgi:hypothetical protein